MSALRTLSGRDCGIGYAEYIDPATRQHPDRPTLTFGSTAPDRHPERARRTVRRGGRRRPGPGRSRRHKYVEMCGLWLRIWNAVGGLRAVVALQASSRPQILNCSFGSSFNTPRPTSRSTRLPTHLGSPSLRSRSPSWTQRPTLKSLEASTFQAGVAYAPLARRPLRGTGHTVTDTPGSHLYEPAMRAPLPLSHVLSRRPICTLESCRRTHVVARSRGDHGRSHMGDATPALLSADDATHLVLG